MTGAAERRVLEACRRRLRDSKAPAVHVPVTQLAAEENLNPRQLRRALRRLAALELLDVQTYGPRSGRAVIAAPSGHTKAAA